MRAKKLSILLLTMALGLNISATSVNAKEIVKNDVAVTQQVNEQSNTNIALSEDDKKKAIESIQKKTNLTPDVQKKLIDKLKNGKVIDSMNPDKVKEIPKGALDCSADKPVAKYVFPDGSYIENSITVLNKIEVTDENRDKLIKAMGDTKKADDLIQDIKQKKLNESLSRVTSKQISPFGVISGSGYAYYFDIVIKRDVVVIECDFYAAFTLVNGSTDKINKVDRASCRVSLGSYSNLDVKPIRAEEDSWTKQPALADCRFDGTAEVTTAWFGFKSSATCHLYLNVGNDTYTVTHN